MSSARAGVDALVSLSVFRYYRRHSLLLSVVVINVSYRVHISRYGNRAHSQTVRSRAPHREDVCEKTLTGASTLVTDGQLRCDERIDVSSGAHTERNCCHVNRFD